MKTAISVQGINKRFGAVHALKNITLDIKEGKTLALIGENGAGKSTLMKILTGAYTNDEGEIQIYGKPVQINSTKDAKMLGIGQVYQRPEFVPELTVAENIFIGENGFSERGVLNWNLLHKKAAQILEKYEINIDTHSTMKELSVAECQLVSVAKVLQRDPQIIIFDEPTAVLSGHEVEILFKTIDKLKEERKTIVYISHRLEEVFKVADNIAIMRDGELVSQLENRNISQDDVIALMLGRKLSAMFPPKNQISTKEPTLIVNKLCTKDVHDISFKLYKSEILGIAGLVGSGRTELAKALYGMEEILSGEVLVDGKAIRLSSPENVVKEGIFLAPEDRKGEGLVLSSTIRENITMSNLKSITKAGLIRKQHEIKLTNEYKAKLSIKAPSVDTHTNNLSGGNQQKVVIAKALAAAPKILIADEPTQGIDVGAKSEIYMLINELAQIGMSIIFISSEMEELMGVCNRIVVMKEGSITGELEGSDVTDSKRILSLMYKVKNYEN